MKPLLPYLILISLAFSFTSCKKNNDAAINPSASFTFRGDNANSFKIGSGDTITLYSQVTNAKALNWDLGNGKTSTSKSIVLSYPNAGSYNVTLTAMGNDGKQVSITKKVTVFDRVLKSITVKSLYWDPTPADIDHFNYVWPQTTTADIFVQFQQYKPGVDPVTPYSGLLPNSPVLLTSNIVPGVSNRTNVAFNIPFSGRLVINKRMIDDRTLAMSLMAKDANGKVYNLMSNLASGSNWIMNEDTVHNSFTITCSLMSQVILYGEYE